MRDALAGFGASEGVCLAGSAQDGPRPSRRKPWRGGRVAEGARLESVFTGNRNVGSNPTPSAILPFADVRRRAGTP